MQKATTRVERCLTDGAWEAGSNADSAGQRWAQMWAESIATLHLTSKFNCASILSKPQEHRAWRGRAPHCDEALLAALPFAFDGVPNGFSSVSLFVLGDSLGRQLNSSLKVLAASSPALNRTLRFGQWDAVHRHAQSNLNFIPATVEGTLNLLHGIVWGDEQQAGPRVVLANSGLHYNVFRRCGAEGEADVLARSLGLCGSRGSSTARLADHRVPTRTRVPGRLPALSSHYEVARAASDADEVAEYKQDVSALVAAARTWLEEDRARHRLIWMETSPQHFALPSALSSARSCTSRQGAYWPTHNVSHITPAARELCGSLAASGGACSTEAASGGRDVSETAPASESALISGCQQCMWQNAVASPLMRAAGIPVVPLSALRHRGSLHVSAGQLRGRLGDSDCTHWCTGTDAMRFMVRAALSTVRAVLDA